MLADPRGRTELAHGNFSHADAVDDGAAIVPTWVYAPLSRPVPHIALHTLSLSSLSSLCEGGEAPAGEERAQTHR